MKIEFHHTVPKSGILSGSRVIESDRDDIMVPVNVPGNGHTLLLLGSDKKHVCVTITDDELTKAYEEMVAARALGRSAA